MRPSEFDKTPAIQHLRLMLQNFDKCPEVFLRRFSLVELWAIYRAWMLSGWATYPHRWTSRQIREALIGKPPRWNERQRAVYV